MSTRLARREMGAIVMDDRFPSESARKVCVGMVNIDQLRCVGCGSCVAACPSAAIALVDGLAAIDPERCDGCGCCLTICPQDAIARESEVLAPIPVATGIVVQPADQRISTLTKLGRLVTYVAPIALDVAVGLMDRWVASRRAVDGPGSATCTDGQQGLRRRRRHGWRD